VLESGEDVFTPVTLPTARAASLIGRRGEAFEPGGHTITVGTKYARLAARHFDGRRLAHEIVPLSGSVELAAALRLTDVVVDLVETADARGERTRGDRDDPRSRATLIVGRRASPPGARRSPRSWTASRDRSRQGKRRGRRASC
jgi:hypothetical protein